MPRTSKALDIVGRVYGRLTVTARHGSDGEGHVRWLCACTCGNSVAVLGRNLTRGRTRSCGCLRQDLARARAQKMRGVQRKPKLMVDYRELGEMA